MNSEFCNGNGIGKFNYNSYLRGLGGLLLDRLLGIS